jgi:hypothetical protein
MAGDLAPSEGPYTVASAIADYLRAYERRGGKSLYTTRRAAETHILPMIGDIPVRRLNARKIEAWHHALSEHGLASAQRPAPAHD